MQTVFHLIYFSQASEDITFSDIQNILQSSRQTNSLLQITGLLIYREGHFIQILEGREADVKNVLGKILLDKRNHGLRVLADFSTEKRIFKDNSMAYVDGDISVNETKELVDLCEEAAKQNLCIKRKLIEHVQKLRESSPALS